VGPTCQAKRTRTRPGWAVLGLTTEFTFLFFWDFSNAFLFIFSLDFKSNSNPIQIQTNSNMCSNQKYNLGSAMMQHFMTHIGFAILNK
jgi:hypothetical protein